MTLVSLTTDRLVCEERLEDSDEEAWRWIALLAEDVDGLEPMSVAVFGPECAREFGYPRSRAQRRHAHA
jgi:hypothetical protein